MVSLTRIESGGAPSSRPVTFLVADKLLHYVTPALFVTYWAVYVRRGTLAWKDPLIWSLYPIAYFLYALVRDKSARKR